MPEPIHQDDYLSSAQKLSFMDAIGLHINFANSEESPCQVNYKNSKSRKIQCDICKANFDCLADSKSHKSLCCKSFDFFRTINNVIECSVVISGERCKLCYETFKCITDLSSHTSNCRMINNNRESVVNNNNNNIQIMESTSDEPENACGGIENNAASRRVLRECGVVIVGERCKLCSDTFKCITDLEDHVKQMHTSRRKTVIIKIGQEVVLAKDIKHEHLEQGKSEEASESIAKEKKPNEDTATDCDDLSSNDASNDSFNYDDNDVMSGCESSEFEDDVFPCCLDDSTKNRDSDKEQELLFISINDALQKLSLTERVVKLMPQVNKETAEIDDIVVYRQEKVDNESKYKRSSLLNSSENETCRGLLQLLMREILKVAN